ncbi:hypothetical protein P7B02_01840 [Caulobacter segnis]|uniref:hypothetical protein n=1 Tax=Caulobacter segnis TaxID=88688 RepID=UPI0024101DF2|nr:hypothetical protein [Caulobacter segnis]MDG2520266.1 hypothetical protein [Caulobacter segnis]
MYQLQVFMPGEHAPIEMTTLPRGGEVLETVSLLLRQFPGCDRIEVFAGALRLFSVEGDSAEARETISSHPVVARYH